MGPGADVRVNVTKQGQHETKLFSYCASTPIKGIVYIKQLLLRQLQRLIADWTQWGCFS